MLILVDNDVIGAVEIVERVLFSPDWHDFSVELELAFVTLSDIGLPADAADRLVWETAQSTSAILVTGNQSGGPDSLDRCIRELGAASSLPVMTIANVQRVFRDSEYARRCAVSLLDFLQIIDLLRGVGRVFIPK